MLRPRLTRRNFLALSGTMRSPRAFFLPRFQQYASTSPTPNVRASWPKPHAHLAAPVTPLTTAPVPSRASQHLRLLRSSPNAASPIRTPAASSSRTCNRSPEHLCQCRLPLCRVPPHKRRAICSPRRLNTSAPPGSSGQRTLACFPLATSPAASTAPKPAHPPA